VTRIQFSNDSRRLLSASRDGTVRVVPVPSAISGRPEEIRAALEADVGVRIADETDENAASFTAPQPLTKEAFDLRRQSSP
jgi:hypothetical protein